MHNKENEKSNAQAWELEVCCKNKKYLDAVVKAILEDGTINFAVELIEIIMSYEDGFDARYTVIMEGSWFNSLNKITEKFKSIEKKFEPII